LPPKIPSRNWPSVKAPKALAAAAPDRLADQAPDILSAYHDRVTLGPTAMKLPAKKTGLTLKDL
jgi:hypothetical protein